MICFDRIMLISKKDYIEIIDENAFIVNMKNGELIYLKFKQKYPFYLLIKIDVESGELLLEFTGKILKDRYCVTIFEKESCPGGLIKCRRVDGSLFHTCGGHVFNSKRQDVLDWFWSRFIREKEFSKADRNSCVFMDEEPKTVPYPIENHMYLFGKTVQESFYQDLEEIDKIKGLDAKFTDYDNFGEFLRWRFGKPADRIHTDRLSRNALL